MPSCNNYMQLSPKPQLPCNFSHLPRCNLSHSSPKSQLLSRCKFRANFNPRHKLLWAKLNLLKNELKWRRIIRENCDSWNWKNRICGRRGNYRKPNWRLKKLICGRIALRCKLMSDSCKLSSKLRCEPTCKLRCEPTWLSFSRTIKSSNLLLIGWSCQMVPLPALRYIRHISPMKMSSTIKWIIWWCRRIYHQKAREADLPKVSLTNL